MASCASVPGTTRTARHLPDAHARRRAVARAHEGERVRVAVCRAGFGPTPNTLLVSADHHGRDAIFELDLRDTKDLQLVFARPSVDVGGPIVWPTDQRIVGFWFDTERPQVDLFDSTALLVQRTLDQALPGTANSVVSATDDGKRLVVSAISDVKPTTYYLLDRDARTMLRPAVSTPGSIVRRRPCLTRRRTASRCGYVSVLRDPTARTCRRVPARRTACATAGTSTSSAVLVSRGYAVVQVNFRGSTGYGSVVRGRSAKLGHRHGRRHQCGRALGRRTGHRRSGAHVHRRVELRRLRGAHERVRESKLYRCAVSIAGVGPRRAGAGQPFRRPHRRRVPGR